MDDFYQKLLEDIDSVKSSSDEIDGVDPFLNQNRVKLSSFDQLLSFSRIGEDTLVHKAEKDLWRISQNNDGEPVIERLFDPSTDAALKV